MALLPAIFVFFICMWRKRRWGLKRFVTICALALVLPSIISLHSFWASNRVHGYNTERHWLPKGMPPDMNFRDLFSVKANDAQLFRAPGKLQTRHSRATQTRLSRFIAHGHVYRPDESLSDRAGV